PSPLDCPHPRPLSRARVHGRTDCERGVGEDVTWQRVCHHSILVLLTRQSEWRPTVPGHVPLYHHLVRQIKRCTAHQPLRHTSVVRLALVVTGIMTARSCVLRQIAAELLALGLTGASTAESVGRRLRRTLNDHRLTVETTYRPLVQQVVGWEGLRRGGQPAVLLVDESSNAEQVHLFRVSLAYRGGVLPLAWALWLQNQAQPREAYWQQVDRVLAEVADLLPSGLTVIGLADRAYDVPAFLDRLAAYGWSWIVRCKARGQLRFRDRQGREQRL